MSPGQRDEITEENWDDVDEHGNVPRYDVVCCSPKKPGLDVVPDIAPVGWRVYFEPVKVNKYAGSNDYARQKGGPNKGGEESWDKAY